MKKEMNLLRFILKNKTYRDDRTLPKTAVRSFSSPSAFVNAASGSAKTRT
jgi:hypothetical protein